MWMIKRWGQTLATAMLAWWFEGGAKVARHGISSCQVCLESLLPVTL